MTRVLVAIKRVVDVAGEIVLTEDEQALDGRYAGHTISDHDACAIELGIQTAEADGGSVTVVSVGAPESIEQIRGALALGAHEAVLVEVEPADYGPADVAAELAAVVRDAERAGTPYDLVLAGNDAADTGDFQVPIRLAHALDRPVVAGVGTLTVEDGASGGDGAGPAGRTLVATVNGPGGLETYEVPLPAVVSVLEGGTAPRYPTLKGRMAAKKVEVDVRPPTVSPQGAHRVRWQVPEPPPSSTVVLGEGPEAAASVVETLRTLGAVR